LFSVVILRLHKQKSLAILSFLFQRFDSLFFNSVSKFNLILFV
jgi:hypothetical protein